ncbi:MAG TPA: metallophosphoesterase [Nitrospirae bacterium]|nr:metallophosphoesterase [Nitrospirota bacterium]
MFFIIVFSIYGGMHLYAFLRARAAFSFGLTSGIFLAFFMLAMTFAPFIVRMLEKYGFDVPAQVLSYTGYIWMGVVFLFFFCSITFDIYRLIVYAGESLSGRNLAVLKMSARVLFLLPLLLSLLIASYGYYEALNIKTEKVEIYTSKLSEETGRLRIVQISDVHIGLIVRESRLKRILAEVISAEPDILVSTGDLVDGQINNIAGIAEIFQEIKPRFGKFAITGNHEFYAGIDKSLEFIDKAGFQILRGKGITVSDVINIAGFDDITGKSFGFYTDVPEEQVLKQLPAGLFTILLKHRPRVDKDAVGHFDLQLSGHSHKGQIFPFSLLTKFYYPVHAGYLKLSDKSSLYVSRGSGTWGPPIRFLAPPEVTVIDLIHKGS